MEPLSPNNLGGASPSSVGSSDNKPLSPTGQPLNRAVKDEAQASDLVKSLVLANAERNKRNARIQARLNAERPYDEAALRKEGLLWKSNFSTQPLSVLLDRASPRFPAALSQVKYLTAAKLRADIQDAEKKSERFQEELTTMCRASEGWDDFTENLAFEDVAFGFTCAAYTDNISLFPKAFRQDEFFVPAKTPHNAAKCQTLVLRETFAPHKLFELIKDPVAAKQVGWNVEETVKLINSAVPDTFRSSTSNDDARRWQDLERSANLYMSLAAGAKEVVLYHLFVTEITGTVSHIICAGDTYKEIFRQYDRFPSMERVATFFSYQQANGELQGSKGVGRTVYNLAGVVDKARNGVFDRLNLSGKIILQGEERDIRRFKMSVVGDTILIDKNMVISQTKLDAKVEEFEKIEAWATRMLDALAGNVSADSVASQLKGERVTDSQVNLVAGLQNEAKDVKVARFLRQFAGVVTNIQLRAVDPMVKDPLSDAFRASCLEVMTQDEVMAISKQKSVDTIADYTDQERQSMVLMAGEYKGDPRFDQHELARLSVSARFGDKLADRVLLPQNDPTIQAEQTRLQLLEITSMKAGVPMPVSPRDNHIIHLEILMQDMERLSQTAQTDPQALEELASEASHAQDHIQFAAQSTPPDQLKKYVDVVQNVMKGLQTMQAAQQGAAPAPAGMPAAPAPVV